MAMKHSTLLFFHLLRGLWCTIIPPFIKSLTATFVLNMGTVDGFSVILTITSAKATILSGVRLQPSGSVLRNQRKQKDVKEEWLCTVPRSRIRAVPNDYCCFRFSCSSLLLLNIHGWSPGQLSSKRIFPLPVKCFVYKAKEIYRG